MNMVSASSKALLCAMVVAFSPVLASEQQNVENTQNSVVWYKKRSSQVIAGLAAATVGLYVFAVYKDKVASPAALFAAFTGLLGVQKDLTQSKNEGETSNDATGEQNSTEQNLTDASQQQKEADVKPNGEPTPSEQTEGQASDLNPEQANPASDVQNPQDLPQNDATSNVSSGDQNQADVPAGQTENQQPADSQQPTDVTANVESKKIISLETFGNNFAATFAEKASNFDPINLIQSI